jgi:pyrroline-5-carboxylate reductase
LARGLIELKKELLFWGLPMRAFSLEFCLELAKSAQRLGIPKMIAFEMSIYTVIGTLALLRMGE